VSFNRGPSVDGNEWKFLIGGAFMTTASSEMVIIGGGSSVNEHWVATGTIHLGAHSVAVSSMETPGALSVGPGTSSFTLDNLDLAGTWTLAISGALALSVDSYIVLTSSTVNWVVSGAIILGMGSTMVGSMKSDFGAIFVGADATCKYLDGVGGLTVGAAALIGNPTASGAITVGANVLSLEMLLPKGALTVGAGTRTGILYPSGACTGSNCPLP
jgi:hypothetical protein